MSRDLRLYLTDILIAGEKNLHYTEDMSPEPLLGLATALLVAKYQEEPS